MRLTLAGLFGGRRSFRADSRAALRSVPPIALEGREHIPPSGPFLVAINHFSAPGMGVWWTAIALSAAMPAEPHWVMTAAWTYADWLRSHTITPLTDWAFRRVARVYGFTIMPPMPPRKGEELARGVAVRRVLRAARQDPGAVVALAPEGHDSPGRVLAWPPPGGGRFLFGLAQRLGRVLPVGASAPEGRPCLRIGPPFRLELPDGLPRERQDRLAARQVMEHIAPLVPAPMRGEFS